MIVANLDDLERLFKLMHAHSVDSVELEGLKVLKTRFVAEEPGSRPPPNYGGEPLDDDTLFYATDDDLDDL